MKLNKLFTAASMIALVIPSVVATAGETFGTVFEENFEAMTDGPLSGQNGWVVKAGTALTLLVDSADNQLGSRSMDGRDLSAARPPFEFVYATRPFSPCAVGAIHATWNAYATVNDSGPVSHSSPVGLGSSSIVDAEFGPRALTWAYNRSTGNWRFDARYGRAGDFIATVPGGVNQSIELGVVVDRDRLEAYGTWDFGSQGLGETPRYAITAAMIDQIDRFYLSADFRGTGTLGIEVDDIKVECLPQPSFLSMTPVGNGLLLRWPSESGLTYLIESGDTLDGVWATILGTSQLGTGAPLSLSLVPGVNTSDTGFYRVRVESSD